MVESTRSHSVPLVPGPGEHTHVPGALVKGPGACVLCGRGGSCSRERVPNDSTTTGGNTP